VPVIVPHFGAGMLREALMLADTCANVHLDTSSSNAWMRYTPGLTLADVFKTSLAVVGAERLLFGTDSSFFPRGWQAGVLAAQVAALDAAGATPEQSRLVLGGSFSRLFPVLAPSP
jgi:predicted TIM-barrel fold metal-dependent hydrolase